MGEKLFVGLIPHGLKTNPLAFNIDNDAFPYLVNAYQWRGRVKRKRGTSALCRLQRALSFTSPITLGDDGHGNGTGNLLTGFESLEANASLVQGSITIVDTTASNTYTDSASILTGTPTGSGTVNYATGDILITGAAGDSITASFNYYPALPVMGLENFNVTAAEFPSNVSFDTVYSYIISTSYPYISHDVSFYKNPSTGTYTDYVAKSASTPLYWNGQSYQQFWTVNYENGFWATNGINVPFAKTNIGMQFKKIATIVYASDTTLNITITEAVQTLFVGDFVFLNEITGSTAAATQAVNFQTGYIITASNDGTTTSITVKCPGALFDSMTTFSGGIVQYLTSNLANPALDCIRWFDGDPSTVGSTLGWVNFAPPLSQAAFSISDAPQAQYYLVGARVIVPFKDYLLFFGPVIQTSSANSQIYLQDTVVFSQNGTPYYTASFQGPPTNPISIVPVLVPNNQTGSPSAFFEDSTGYGGSIAAGYAQPILAVAPNEDVLIVGFTSRQARFVSTGDSFTPFNFFVINSEYGSGSTFSVITLDRGDYTVGNHGIIITSQIAAQRIDLDIPDQIFQFNLNNNGFERVTAQRDFINEWVYFTYLDNEVSYAYPNQTLLYNYRDNSWAIFNECYTTYGQFRKTTGLTWLTLDPALTWETWDSPWNSSVTTVMQPLVIAGNPQGFVVSRETTTQESNSLAIQSFSGITVTSPDHCLNNGDYIIISGCLGTIGDEINGNIYQITNATASTFQIAFNANGYTYLGGGVIKRMYIPYIQTKQFNLGWANARKTRIGAQQYMFTTTTNGQIELQIFLSQGNVPYNYGPIVPQSNSINNSLIYSDTLFTSPDVYIQYCNNVSLGKIGNGSLTTITLSLNALFQVTQLIVSGSVVITIGPNNSPTAIFTDNGSGGFTVTGTGVSSGSSIVYNTGIITLVFSAAPSALPSTITFNYYVNNILSPNASAQEQIWHRFNTSLIGDSVQIGFTLSDEQMRDPSQQIQFSEIELHGFCLDVQPSSVLA